MCGMESLRVCRALRDLFKSCAPPWAPRAVTTLGPKYRALVGNGIHEAAATTSKATSKILTGERGRCTTSTTTAIIRGRSHGPLTDTRRLGGGDR